MAPFLRGADGVVDQAPKSIRSASRAFSLSTTPPLAIKNNRSRLPLLSRRENCLVTRLPHVAFPPAKAGGWKTVAATRLRQFACLVVAMGIGAHSVQAHKPITSKYTYTEDVFPILNERCGRCHVLGGVAPMSFLTYKDAFPWAESIRVELASAHMPPWFAEIGN